MKLLEKLTQNYKQKMTFAGKTVIIHTDEEGTINLIETDDVIMMDKNLYYDIVGMLKTLLNRNHIARNFMKSYTNALPPELSPVQRK